jgi:hypothetical protein
LGNLVIEELKTNTRAARHSMIFDFPITKFPNYSIFLSAGEFDLAFDLGGDAIAGCGTIPPRAHGLQDVTVAGESGALKNQWAVDAPVGANDETDSYFPPVLRCGEQRIGRGQSLGRLNLFARWPRTDVRDVDELRGSGE